MSNRYGRRVRLVVPDKTGKREDHNKHIAAFEQVLRSDKFGVERKNMTEISEPPYTRMVEETFDVSCEREFSHTLLITLRKFFSLLEKDFPECEIGTLVLQSKGLFCRYLMLEQSCGLNSVHFGNVMHGEFYDHWKVSSLDAKMPDGNFRINVDLRFDDRHVLVVSFRNAEPLKNHGIDCCSLVSYQLKLAASSIRQILVDLGTGTAPSTRMFFDLVSPVVVCASYDFGAHFQRELQIRRGKGRSNPAALTESPHFCLDFGTVTELKIYEILSRFRHRFGTPIAVTRIKNTRDLMWYANYMGKPPVYSSWVRQGIFRVKPTDLRDPKFKSFLDRTFPNPPNCSKELRQKIQERRFAYNYLIEALLSRGAVVKDKLLLDVREWDKFLDVITKNVLGENNPGHEKNCEAALEDLVTAVDANKPITDICQLLQSLCHTRCVVAFDNDVPHQSYSKGYRRVRKLVLTPTRVIYILPELTMSNRAIRKFDKDGTNIVRVVFREEDNMPCRKNAMGRYLREKIEMYMNYTVICNTRFIFLGCSGSQMRECGAYFLRSISGNPEPRLVQIRQQLATLDETKGVPKALARLGMCFTQTEDFEITLKHDEYAMTSDMCSGKDPKGKPYTMTDGVGMMSRQMRDKICKLKMGNGTTSAFQIRFRGFKGMLVVNSLLDEQREWAHKGVAEGWLNASPRVNPSHTWAPQCVFRTSQDKFVTLANADGFPLEIVKAANPSLVTLNRPLVNILDQASEKQSPECHKRVKTRIEQLTNAQLATFAECLIDEDVCRTKIKEFPHRIDIDCLQRACGFRLSAEPFFRSLVRAAVLQSFSRLQKKTQIQVPASLGRSMFGVTDETSQLQSGQVFVQYTKNGTIRNVGPNSARVVLTGRVLVTKCPSVVAGDVRMFEAVDIPELHDICDCIVFPQHGPRSQPDEMAGSDLDGDEYTVIWDEGLFLDHSAPAFDYTNDVKAETFAMKDLQEKMIDFYIQYQENDSMGLLSLQHLYQSDQFGIDSEVAMKIAKKLMLSLDFGKTGQAPDLLTPRWNTNVKPHVQPEKAERLPDYNATEFSMSPVYKSHRLLGKLSRDLAALGDVINRLEDSSPHFEAEIDKLLYVKDWEGFKPKALAELRHYNAMLNNILDRRGVKTEAELFSGCILELRGRQTERQQSGESLFSQFNVEHSIGADVTRLFEHFRVRFFGEFGGYEANTEEMESSNYDGDSILRRVCVRPTLAMKQKACAYYHQCYTEANATQDQKLSFAWIAYDILSVVRTRNWVNSKETVDNHTNPIYKVVQKQRFAYSAENEDKLGEFLHADFVAHDLRMVNALVIIRKYVTRNRGLERVLFVLCEWVASAVLPEDDCRLNRVHCALIVLLVGTKLIDRLAPTVAAQDDLAPIIQPIRPDDEDDATRSPLAVRDRNRLTTSVLKFMASGEFRDLRHLSFQFLGVSSVFMRKEWLPFHRAAVTTYFNLMLNLRFDELKHCDCQLLAESKSRECRPFLIELPAFAKSRLSDLLRAMKRRSGVEEIGMRGLANNSQTTFAKSRHSDLLRAMKRRSGVEEIGMRDLANNSQTIRYIVSARGSHAAQQRLRELVSFEIPRHAIDYGSRAAYEIALCCYHKILGDEIRKSRYRQLKYCPS